MNDPPQRRRDDPDPKAQGKVPEVKDKAARIDVRELELDDLSAVFALGERIFTAENVPTLHRTWDPYEVVAFFSGDPETSLVAVDEQTDQVCGFALGTVLEKRRSAWTYGYLVWLGVDPAYARSGVGRKLLNELTDRFIAQGARMMLVDTEADNDGAVSFFRRNGFGHPRPHVFLSRNLTREPAYRKLRQAAESSRGPTKEGTRGRGPTDGAAPPASVAAPPASFAAPPASFAAPPASVALPPSVGPPPLAPPED